MSSPHGAFEVAGHPLKDGNGGLVVVRRQAIHEQAAVESHAITQGRVPCLAGRCEPVQPVVAPGEPAAPEQLPGDLLQGDPTIRPEWPQPLLEVLLVSGPPLSMFKACQCRRARLWCVRARSKCASMSPSRCLSQ